jgi:hypothetical protein
MDFRTILVPIEEHDFMNSTLETALLLARKFDSYIEGFALRVAISAAYAPSMLRSLLAASNGCTKSSTTASASSRARTANG